MARQINLNTKHLKTGDPLPPYTGKLRVYSMRFCPYAQRTILALNAKQVDYEVVNINLFDKPEWLFKKSGFGKVPSLEIQEDVCIYESLVTVEYIDDVFPQRPLVSKDPVTKAFDKIIIESMVPVQMLVSKCIKAPESVTQDAITAYYKALDFLQEQLKSRGTQFLAGSEPGFVDYMIWPWFEWILSVEGDKDIAIHSDKYKLLVEYFGCMFKDPAVSPYLLPKGIHQKLIEGYRIEHFSYDSLLENL